MKQSALSVVAVSRNASYTTEKPGEYANEFTGDFDRIAVFDCGNRIGK